MEGFGKRFHAQDERKEDSTDNAENKCKLKIFIKILAFAIIICALIATSISLAITQGRTGNNLSTSTLILCILRPRIWNC